MKYNEIIKHLEDGGEIHYYTNYLSSKEDHSLVTKDGESLELSENQINRLIRNYKCRYQLYAIEGKEETGFLHVKLAP